MKILDSDHWIAALRGRLDLRGRVAAAELLVITAISVGELVYGAARSTNQPTAQLALDTLFAGIIVLPYDETAARTFGLLRRALEQRGERLDDADLQIASIALSQDVLLVTHNARHFSRVPGLRLEDWLE